MIVFHAWAVLLHLIDRCGSSMAKKFGTSKSIVRRVQRPATDSLPVPLQHDEAFQQAYGAHTYQIRSGSLSSRVTDEASTRAAACISACEGLGLNGLRDGGIRQLIEAARSVERLMAGRLVRSDPEATLVIENLRKALKKLSR
jgi:hypothetical protein